MFVPWHKDIAVLLSRLFDLNATFTIYGLQIGRHD